MYVTWQYPRQTRASVSAHTTHICFLVRFCSIASCIEEELAIYLQASSVNPPINIKLSGGRRDLITNNRAVYQYVPSRLS